MRTTPIMTHRGTSIILISAQDLCEPLTHLERIRAYCHLHGGDKQRSLAINRETGWGHCFNASCEATVLVEEFNPLLADALRKKYTTPSSTSSTASSSRPSHSPIVPSRASISLARTETPLRPTPSWQQNEVGALRALDTMMREALLTSWKAQAYLDDRAISLSVAQAAGLGYLSRDLVVKVGGELETDLLRRWADRLLFPLTSPAGRGYIGRSLWRWKPGMNENTHKTMLDQPQTPRRWIKTNPAGWCGYDPSQLSTSIVLVEGGFDRLALLSVGLSATTVVALAGTALRVDWLTLTSSQVKAVVLALDGDTGGNNAMQRLAETLRSSGFVVALCPPLHDQWGKDWSERWRRIGPQSVWPLYEVLARVSHSTEHQ